MENNIGFVAKEDGAMLADSGGRISASCVGVGVIKKFSLARTTNGASYAMIDLENDQGESAKFMRIYTKNKDGSDNFARKKVDAMCHIVGVKQLEFVQIGEGDNAEFVVPDMRNQRIGFSLQKEEFMDNDGVTVKFKMNLMHTFYASNMKTYSEHKNSVDAKTSLRVYPDIKLSDNGGGGSSDPQSGGFGADGGDDQLPF